MEARVVMTVTLLLMRTTNSHLTIPGHSPQVLNSLRWTIGRHYYPRESGEEESHDLTSSTCLAHSALSLASSRPWSTHMWDACGKVGDGVAAGNTEVRGQAEVCREVSAIFPGTLASHLNPHLPLLASLNLTLASLHPHTLLQRDTHLRGRYCLVTLREEKGHYVGPGGGSWEVVGSLSGHHQHTYATCIPHTCSPRLLQERLQQQQQWQGVVLTVTCDHHHNQIQHAHSYSYTLFVVVTVGLVALVGAATLQEQRAPCRRTRYGCPCPPGVRILHCFSLTDNWRRLTADSTAETHLQTLDGLRVVNMVWVVMAHRYMLLLTSASNPRDITKHLGEARYWWMFNAYPSVDTFLFTSAFLTGLLLQHRLHQYSFLGFCLKRYLRLVPALAYVLWACVSLLPQLGSGPVWERTYGALFSRPCSSIPAILASLLLLTNFRKAEDMCMGQLWSLSVEWQLYLLTPLLLLPLYRWPSWRYRWLPLLTCLALALILPAVLTIAHDLPPTATHWDHHATRKYYEVYYVTPWCRAGPYLVGLLGALFCSHLQHHHLFLTQGCVVVVGCVGWVVVAGVLLGPAYITGQGRYWAALYSALARPAWAAALAAFVIIVARGNPGVWSWLLSRPVFARLCRLSYCVFLVSLPLQTLASARPHKHHYDHLTGMYWVVGDLCLSTGVGLVLVLLVESPAARLVSLITSGKLFRPSQSKQTEGLDQRQHEVKRGKQLVATLSSASYFSSPLSSSIPDPSSSSSSPFSSSSHSDSARFRNI